MRRLVRLTTAAAIALAAVGSVAATDGDCHLVRGGETTETSDDVEVCRQTQWLHRAETPAGNASTHDSQSLPTFDTTAPDASVTTGAGGGWLGMSAYQNTGEFDPAYTPTFVGSFDGDIDNVLVELYHFPLFMMAMDPTDNPAGSPFEVDAWLYVDGELVGSHSALVVPREDAGNAVQKSTFVFPDVYDAIENAGLAGKDGAYDVELRVVGKGLAGDVAIWVYDTTEVPSNLVFNATPAELDGVAGMPFVWPGA